MSIKYICQYCGTKIGEINSEDITEMQLGLHFLTPEERQHIISYEGNGDVVAKITCEYCAEAVNRHPDLSNPLQ